MQASDVALARSEITNQLGRYSLAVDFRDFERLRSFFDEQPDVSYDLRSIGGDMIALDSVEAVIGWLRQLIGDRPARAERSLTNHVIDVSGDSAHSRSYLSVAGMALVGSFTIDWTRIGSEWRAKVFRMCSYAP